MDQTARNSLLDQFSALDDPRQAAKVLYPLPEILLLLLCATLAGAEDFVEMTLWGNRNLDFLRRLRPFAQGIPSHDTLGEVIRAVDPELFKSCFTAWVDGLRESEPDIIAIDGKTSRRTHARSKGRAPLHLVSAWASRQRLVLGQQAVAGKSNEIVAIPLLLERLALTGALVTIDAIGTQSAIAKTILQRGGDYLLALKANRRASFEDVEAFFAAPPPGSIETFQTTDGDHGRIESRRHHVCHDVGWLFSERRYPHEVAFPGLAMIAMVESEIERDGKTSRERRYYLSSAKLDAKTFAKAVRAHWGIENRLHWVLDVVFHDDLARLRTGYGPENMAVVKHFAVNLVHAAKPITSLKNRRKLASWDLGYLETLIRGTA
ncbi:MAG: ISAs1 family transposase [Gammaproteobacteria bacterium]